MSTDRLRNALAGCKVKIITIVAVILIGVSMGGCFHRATMSFAQIDRPVMLGKIHNIKGETLIGPYILKRKITIDSYKMTGWGTDDREIIDRSDSLLKLIDSETNKVVIDKLYFGLFWGWWVGAGYESSADYWLRISGGIYSKGLETQKQN